MPEDFSGSDAVAGADGASSSATGRRQRVAAGMRVREKSDDDGDAGVLLYANADGETGAVLWDSCENGDAVMEVQARAAAPTEAARRQLDRKIGVFVRDTLMPIVSSAPRRPRNLFLVDGDRKKGERTVA